MRMCSQRWQRRRGVCPELVLLAIFLGRTKPLLAFRTEWCIWATKEKVAGCIDFAAIDEKGHLVFLGLQAQVSNTTRMSFAYKASIIRLGWFI